MTIKSEWIQAAANRINGKIIKSPLTYDARLNVYIKWENQQETGAFKVRGALNKILSLEPWEQERGLVAVSAGNHGLGVAYAAKMVGAKATVFIPGKTAINKEEAIYKFGANVKKIDGDYSQAEMEAQNYAVKKGSTWISPYNDEQVIAGQATLGLELIDQIKPYDSDACLVPVSGGALISGIGLAFTHNKINTHLIGIQSANSPFFYSLYHFGTAKNIVENRSIADGLTGGVERNSITIPIVRSLLDDFILVEEEEIERAIAYIWYHYNVVIEGSAAVPLAAVLSKKNKANKPVLILSGGNIHADLHKEICERWKERI
jgi:threonine dehydratase